MVNVSDALGLTRRFFSAINNPVPVRSGCAVLKKTKPDLTSWVPPQIRPYDLTGLYYSREEQIRLAMAFRLKLRGKGPPKKGQGKKSQMKKKK
ncbi:hypothetical protein C9374_005102 [Naegleria lovaniensis]|uniref:Small ribosomal subunit protein mS33 n=1 Tax=Naegleria lovaniensis TaxID=51637 RepID=A0AA88GQH9_NAELO|nr:uncharacterized protein C9374_005102 [Naegleria lovaniensis]KAG2382522.1 hypothetical protein C9374_005102 [Naegleria lovaniensis]